ncbi:nephrin-like isoform X2 [Harmonia axyridis]|uniref:nephrin-like isoform X2 n=1 Tax=Harmonia axyridis TaxID=115357 RepID=UPI001E2784AE|nr:nephrin-like isoform X2 [Harmonia axyridis]
MFISYNNILIFLFFMVHLHETIGLKISEDDRILFEQNSRNERKSKRNQIKIDVLEKKRATLPCNITTPSYDESIYLIVWYKDENTSIFSDDRRRKRIWSSEPDRIKFFFNKNSAELVIDNVTRTDAGVFKCSIEYSKSATENQYIELNVIVPPDEVKVIDENGLPLSSITGPHKEGDDVTLRCVVYGGTPTPKVSWLRNNKFLEESLQQKYVVKAIVEKTLTIRNITRSIIPDIFTCRASNNNEIGFQKNIKIDINLPPLSVKIETSVSLSAIKEYRMTCKSFGSRPPATIEWFIGNKKVDSVYVQTVEADDNSSISVLTFTPKREENGLDLICRAKNNYLNEYRNYSIPLNISYPPKPIVALGSSYKSEYFKEGDNVYFDCKVDANPGPNKLSWLHNNRLLQDDKKNGILIRSTHLILNEIKKNQKGNYQCLASNTEGNAVSEAYNLQIKYKPICKEKQLRYVYGVERMKTVEVKCEVESHPPPLKFEWKFNNSARNNEISPKRISNEKFTSIVKYMPMNENDYGTLLCLAENEVGRQTEPCVFHVVPVGKPDRPSNCTLLNVSSYSLEIKCLQGYDGGLPQNARLEIYDKMTSVLVKNATSDFSSICIEDLKPGISLRIIIYSENSKGRSEPVVLEADTLMSEDKLSVLAMDEDSRLGIVPLLGIIIGFVFIMIILSLAAFIIIKLKKCKFPNKSYIFSVDNSKINPTPQKRPNGGDFSEKDENNPDIIPVYANITQMSSNNSIRQSPHENVYTTTEDFLTKSREPELYGLTYVELQPIPLVYSDNKKLIPTKNKEERVIYADIEHNRKDFYCPKKSINVLTVNPESSFSSGKSRNHQREVVTTKAPFMGHHQESCV